jgi:hypothetical protein
MRLLLNFSDSRFIPIQSVKDHGPGAQFSDSRPMWGFGQQARRTLPQKIGLEVVEEFQILSSCRTFLILMSTFLQMSFGHGHTCSETIHFLLELMIFLFKDLNEHGYYLPYVRFYTVKTWSIAKSGERHNTWDRCTKCKPNLKLDLKPISNHWISLYV